MADDTVYIVNPAPCIRVIDVTVVLS
jgi:hypothetical protein